MAWVPIAEAPPYFHFTHLPPLLTTCPGRPTRKCLQNTPEKVVLNGAVKTYPEFPAKNLLQIYFNLSTPLSFLLLRQKAKLISPLFLKQCLLILIALPTQGFLSTLKKKVFLRKKSILLFSSKWIQWQVWTKYELEFCWHYWYSLESVQPTKAKLLEM